MIKINASDEKMKEIEQKHWSWFKEEVKPELEKEKNCLFFKYLNDNAENIIKGKFSDIQNKRYKTLKEIYEEIENKFPQCIAELKRETKLKNSQYKTLYNKILKIFNYESVFPNEIKFSKNIYKNNYQDKIQSLDLRKSNLKIKKNQILDELQNKSGINVLEIKKINTKSDIHTRIYSKIKIEVKNLKSYFNYENYKKLFPNEWGKYQLVYELGIPVCPYCNRSFVTTYYSNSGKSRADLDHFLPKSKYPFFALSLYNLVPSCKICNSSLKGSKEFDFENYINPYEAKLDFNFKIKTNEPDVFQGISDDFIIDFNNIGKSENLDLFKIKELYQSHKDYVREIIKKAVIYNESYINELFQEYEGTLFKNREEVLQMIVSNYINEDELDKRVLAKLTMDICEELGLKNN